MKIAFFNQLIPNLVVKYKDAKRRGGITRDSERMAVVEEVKNNP